MPTNAVKTPRDEHLWSRAKEQAAKQGRAGDWAYVMGIYQRMKGSKSLEKGWNESANLSIAAALAQHRGGRHPVGVPDRQRLREEREIMAAAQTPPRPFKASMLLDDATTPLRIEGIVRNLGMDVRQERDWITYLENAFHAAANEVTLRRMVMDKCQGDNLHPAQRKLIMQRSLGLYRTTEKSLVEVYTPDQLFKAEPKGGKYYRRVARKSGKGYTYYYDQDSYERSKSAHVDGAQALEKRIMGEAGNVVKTAGEKGCDVKAFKDLVKKYGAKAVGGALKKCVATKSLAYRGNKFHTMTAPAGQQRPDPPKSGKDDEGGKAPPDKGGKEESGKKPDEESGKKDVEKSHRFVVKG